jgi:hypothetical protein
MINYFESKNMLSKLKDNHGSTSVLIVILMIVLMAFGMAALTTSYAGFRLAQKNVEFNQQFYMLEGKATSIKFDVANMITEKRQGLLQELKIENETNINEEVDYYNSLAIAVEDELLEYLKANQDVLIQSSFQRDSYDSSSQLNQSVRLGTLNYTVSIEPVTSKQLVAKLDLYAPPKSENLSLDDLIVTYEWYEWQEGIGEVSDSIFFEDPFEEDFESEFLDEIDADEIDADEIDTDEINPDDNSNNSPFKLPDSKND